ncbi:MAG: DUF3365 domain-containing protein [Planctomycetes bacterium]|nr:DUF3365 domain-containing protein [Planctomycetota bacterium]
MRVRRPSLIALLLANGVMTGTACARTAVPPVPDAATIARAQAAADSLGPDLMGMLLGELARGGPESAVAVCADSAQVRPARHARDGLVVRRVGTRVRNPSNAPDSVERRLLAHFQTEQDAGRPMQQVAEVTRTADGAGWELRLVRPVVLLDRCTTCHGSAEEIPPAARALITARYPEDEAVGYRAGDLRGAVSVRVAMPAMR